MELFEDLTVLCLCLYLTQPENSLKAQSPPFFAITMVFHLCYSKHALVRIYICSAYSLL